MKLRISNNHIFKLGYVFYGMSMLLVTVTILLSINTKYFASDTGLVNVTKENGINENLFNNLNKPHFTEPNELKIKIGKNDLSTNDLSNIFEKHSYLIEIVRDAKQVPDIKINKFPYDFDQINSIEIKKSLFIKSLLPLIIQENNKILSVRKKIRAIDTKNIMHISKSDGFWLKKQYVKYKVQNHDIDSLLLKVDTIPVSIALAQAAIESGWGTSRFVIEGNALFGQWSWNKESGIIPTERDKEATYVIKSFDSLGDSIASYMKNLNTNNNYSDFRKFRKEFKTNGNSIDSIKLLKFLDKYAENENYSNILEEIIDKNDLKDFDEVTIYIAPFDVANLVAIQQ